MAVVRCTDLLRLEIIGTTFALTHQMEIVFEGMEEAKEKLMSDYSILVDCINLALSHGGFVVKK